MRLLSLCASWLDRGDGVQADAAWIGSHAPKGGKAIRTLVLLALTALVGACSQSDPEAQLRETIAAMQQAVESRDASALMSPVGDDFIGTGAIDRGGIGRLARLHFLRNAAISAVVGPLEVTMEDDHARVGFTVLLTGGSGGWLPERGQLYSVQTGWRRQDGDWRLITADWESVVTR
jgi:ketosteroid isomerase-like protein